MSRQQGRPTMLDRIPINPQTKAQLREQAHALRARFAQLPRIAQWGFYAAVAFIVFLIWSDYIAPTTRSWSASADRIQRDVRTVRDSARLEQEFRRMRPLIVGIGPAAIPRDVAEGSAALHAAWNEIHAAHSVSNPSFSISHRGSMGRSPLSGLLGGRQVETVTGVVAFDAAPDVAISVISALESRPEIESVSQLSMQRIANRRVTVRLTVEAWVIGDQPASRSVASTAGRAM